MPRCNGIFDARLNVRCVTELGMSPGWSCSLKLKSNTRWTFLKPFEICLSCVKLQTMTLTGRVMGNW